MSKSKQTIAELKEKLADMKTEIRQNENRVKELIQKKNIMERKERTRRLIERGAILESFIDGAPELTNEQLLGLLQTAFSKP